MAQISAKGDAARQWLVDHPDAAPKRGGKPAWELSDDYANRMASQGRKLLDAGITPDRQAMRGHVLTPEHGKQGAAPKLAEKPERYKNAGKLAKEARLTDEAASRPSPRVREGLTEGKRPRIVHTRPPFQGHIPFGEGGEIYTRTSERETREVLRYAADLNNGQGERLTMHVYDCSKKKYFPVFYNQGHGKGINANALLEMWKEHGGDFDEFLMNTINAAGTSSGVSGRISHVCLYEVTILPRPTAAVKNLQQRMG